MARRTTEQLIEALKEAKNHEERLGLLRRAGIGQLRKLGKIEMMAEFGRGWTVETLSLRILDQLERRYARIDGGKMIYMGVLFGMPIELNTPLLKSRREKRENGETLDEIEIDETPDVSSEILEDTEEVTEKFEIGKTYKDKESGNVLTIEKRGTKRIYCYLNGEKESMYYRATIYAEKGTEYVVLEDRDGNVLKFTATKEEEETSVDFETTPVAAEILGEAKTMTEITEEKIKASKALIESEEEEGRKTGESIVSGKSKPLTKKEMWRKDKIYLIGVYKGLTGKTAKRIWWRKRDLIADIWEEQLRIFPEKIKEAKTMKKVTMKELRAEARELGLKGYSGMRKAELEVAVIKAEVEYAARDGESMKQTTIEELRTEAKEFGVVGYKRMTRVELVKRLSDLRKMFPSELEEKADEAETQKTCDESLARYEEVRSAYKEYYDAQGDYVESDPADEGLKDKADKAYSRYLKALSEYRSGEMSEREETVRRIRDICETTYWPLERLLAKGIDWLIEISHKCGINAAHYKRMSERDMAIRLLREAGIETRAETFYERFQKQRKELQKELHELWVKRHAIRKAQHMFEENSPEYEALSGVWEESYKAEADELMEEYQTIIEHLKEERRQAA